MSTNALTMEIHPTTPRAFKWEPSGQTATIGEKWKIVCLKTKNAYLSQRMMGCNWLNMTKNTRYSQMPMG